MGMCDVMNQELSRIECHVLQQFRWNSKHPLELGGDQLSDCTVYNHCLLRTESEVSDHCCTLHTERLPSPRWLLLRTKYSQCTGGKLGLPCPCRWLYGRRPVMKSTAPTTRAISRSAGPTGAWPFVAKREPRRVWYTSPVLYRP